MYKYRNLIKSLLGVTLGLVAAASFAQSTYPGIGRTATPKEVMKWDIDVRPDFKGLPAGSGSVAQGQDVWEGKCASCHGIFGESNQVFQPIIGGTTKEDIKTGHVAKFADSRTTIMKVATVSTLWDYINRAMPWNAPKSLKTDEVYAVLAFMLNLADIVPENYVLSDKNIAEVQAKMPNRNGMRTDHFMWPGNEFKGTKKPDNNNIACMKDCKPESKVESFLPDFARNAHGNLALQNRPIGAQVGADTSKPEGKTAARPVTTAAPVVANPDAAAKAMLTKHNCLACHGLNTKIVGPAFTDVSKKYNGNVAYLLGKIRSGGQGVWGNIPMPAQTLPDADLKAIAEFLAK
jgi:cytochrome c551/c552